jgi:hypothetical protein
LKACSYLFGSLLSISAFKQLLFTFTKGTKHVLWEALPIRSRLFEINVEIVVQAESLIAPVGLLQLQQEVTLPPLVLRLVEDLVIVLLVVCLVAALRRGGTHHLELTLCFLLVIHPVVVLDFASRTGCVRAEPAA